MIIIMSLRLEVYNDTGLSDPEVMLAKLVDHQHSCALKRDWTDPQDHVSWKCPPCFTPIVDRTFGSSDSTVHRIHI